MDVNGTNSVATASAPAASQPATLTADFQTFLRMLTVQMQNQDPLNPMEASDFAVQLATFSGVEQQVRTNQMLTTMTEQFAVMNMSQLAGWVGQEARAAADVWFSGQPVTLSPNPVLTADQTVLVVRDEKGALISREEIPVSTDSYEWQGKDAAGNILPEGRYKISLESSRNGEVLADDPIEYYALITEARGSATGAVLVLQGGIEVPSGDVTALRRAPISTAPSPI